jgi:S-adenosylmethionine decarboxylase
MESGCEWVVDAAGCDPATLTSLSTLQALFDELIESLTLNPVSVAQWHQFPGAGGITGLVLLAESHLTVHTFPENGTLCLNLFCCKPRPEWAFERELRGRFGAAEVTVRSLERITAWVA